MGALDFAGGTVVHIASGTAALAAALVLKARKGFPGKLMIPHSLPLTLLGAGPLWFGWFGFNAGSALAADEIAVLAFTNTQIATAAGLIGWLIAEVIKVGKASALGAASGIVAGLVAIIICRTSLGNGNRVSRRIHLLFRRGDEDQGRL